MRGDMTWYLPLCEPHDYSVTDALTEKFGGTWKPLETLRGWTGEVDGATLVAEIVGWSDETTRLPIMPHRVIATIQVRATKMGDFVGLFPISKFEIAARGRSIMYNELYYANFGLYPESGQSGGINGPIDNKGKCGMIP